MLDRSQYAQWDPLSLTYSFDGEEIELPMRLLVVGWFSTTPFAESRREPIAVRKGHVDTVVKDLAPVLELNVIDHLVGDGGTWDIRVEVRSLADFEPEHVARRTPVFKAVLDLMERLRQGVPVSAEEDSVGDASEEARILKALGFAEGGENELWREYAIAELADRLGRQLDEILHHPYFQALEANWRGLRLVTDQISDEMHCRVDVLDVSHEDLLEDFRSQADADASLLFQTLHAREFGQYGGEPYAAVIGAYQFGPGFDDVELLRHIARVASYAHAPFIAGAAPSMFGLRRFEELVDATSLPELKRSARFAKWRGFVDEELTRYLALTAPRILLRGPYDGERRGKTTFPYREDISADHSHALWGVASFSVAGLLLRSFERYRVCVDIVGPDGGRVRGLPAVRSDEAHGLSYPVEVLLSERKEAELAELGFMPLIVARAHDYIAFNSAHSLHWAAVEEDVRRRDDADSLGLRLGAQLPYVFLISRVAHYLKVIQRDMVGTLRSEAEMETELHSWLRRYVSDVENPAPALRARRPLRKAELRVTDEEGDGSAYRMHLNLVPHTRFMSSEFSLSLEGRLGKE